MIWFTARIAERSAYLLFEPQPPMKRPTISSEETARKKRTPMLRSATPRSGANGIVAKISRHGVLLEDQLETVGERLEPAVRPADVIGPDARLHPRRELALEQDDVGDEDQDRVEDDEGLDGAEDHRRQRHRSTSPKTGSTEPMIATTSATLWPGTMCGRTARFEN